MLTNRNEWCYIIIINSKKGCEKMEKEMKKSKNAIISSSISPFLTERPPVNVTHITEIVKEHTFPRHTDYPSIWICLDGEFLLRTEHGNVHCASGSVVIVPAGTLYYPEVSSAGKLSVMRIFTEYNTYKNVNHAAFISSITHLLLHAFSKELGFEPVRTVILSAASLEQAKTLFFAPSLKSIEKFFSLPEFSLSDKQKKTALSVFSRRLLPVLDAMTYIHKNYSQKITSESLAKASRLCRTNLFTLFKRYLDVSPLTYLVMIRVVRAQFALTHTQYSLQYISDMCGFANCSHMSKCYRQYKGFLPREDRAKMKRYRKKYPNLHVSHDYFFKEE